MAVESLCTMRNWDSHLDNHSSPSSGGKLSAKKVLQSDRSTGPELIFQPVQDALDNHHYHHHAHHAQVDGMMPTPQPLHHPARPKTQPTATRPSYSVPLEEIVVVERMKPRRSGARQRHNQTFQLTLTTIHQGVLEIDLHNANGHDMLLAFLSAHLPSERIQIISASVDGCGASVDSTCSSLSQLDVDRLLDKTIHNTTTSETWPEKLSRRVSKVVHTLESISGTICDLTVCCRDGSAAEPTTTQTGASTNAEVRDAAPHIQPTASYSMPVANGGHLEMDEGEFSILTGKSSTRRRRSSMDDDDDPALVHVLGPRSR